MPGLRNMIFLWFFMIGYAMKLNQAKLLLMILKLHSEQLSIWFQSDAGELVILQEVRQPGYLYQGLKDIKQHLGKIKYLSIITSFAFLKTLVMRAVLNALENLRV